MAFVPLCATSSGDFENNVHVNPQGLLLLQPTDHDRIQDFVSTLLTRYKGEYVFRIGARPAHDKLFSGAQDDSDGAWHGSSVSEEQLDTARTVLIQAVEEVGGKVSQPSGVKHAYGLC